MAIDRLWSRLYSNGKFTSGFMQLTFGSMHMATIIMTDEKFTTLDQKIDALIELCASMKQENQLLRANEHNWLSERQQLLENNKLAKSRLESVLNRLKSLEQSQS